MKTMHEVAREMNDIAVANQWDPVTWENLPSKTMMTVTELNEACDYVYGRGDDPLAEELADTSIRILSILHGVWGNEWFDRTPIAVEVDRQILFRPVEVLLWRILRPLCQAVEVWRSDNRRDTQGFLENALKETFILAGHLGIDLRVAISCKANKNRTRGKLHGKVRSAG